MKPLSPTPRFTARIELDRLRAGSGLGIAECAELHCADGAHHADAHRACVVIGAIRFTDAADIEVARRVNAAAAFLQAWGRDGEALLGRLRGDFAVLAVDAGRGEVLMAVDRFAVQTLCHAVEGPRLFVSDRADALPLSDRSLDPQAIYDYLYFHMIPAPGTIFRAVQRLPMGHARVYRGGTWKDVRHVRLDFVEDSRPDFATERRRFLQVIEEAVAREAAGEGRVGAFLSGGTDSSTVAGMLCKVTGSRAPVYSIGFQAEGYDEMEYARIAARHFGCEHHEYYLTPDDLAEAIPAVAAYHDQPFGNSSAVPAYVCARVAREDGCTKMLAGDGGDELFGGNSRYAMQTFLQGYHALPEGLRRWLEPHCTEDNPLRRIPGLRQAMGYVRHSRLPMPERLQSMNLVASLGAQRILSPALMRQLDLEAPLRHMRGTWAASSATRLINRMLAYDWRYTLADSDLPKVRGATSMAGMRVAYPLLSDELTDLSMTLPANWKLRRFKLRWFFKEALRGFLPDEIITKKKHGFGLPFGVWAVRHDGLRALVSDSLDRLVGRGVLQDSFRKALLTEYLPAHPGYYGEMVWLLMTLEQWLGRAVPDWAVTER